MASELPFTVHKIAVGPSNGRPGYDRVEIRHKNGIYVGDISHWLLWEALNGERKRNADSSARSE